MRDSVPSVRYSSVCNVLRLWRISLIPTYRVYRLYDKDGIAKENAWKEVTLLLSLPILFLLLFCNKWINIIPCCMYYLESRYSRRQKKVPPFDPYNGHPFKKNGRRTGIERELNGR